MFVQIYLLCLAADVHISLLVLLSFNFDTNSTLCVQCCAKLVKVSKLLFDKLFKAPLNLFMSPNNGELFINGEDCA